MAEKEVTFTLTWENDATFKLKFTDENSNMFTVVETDENNTLRDIWDYVASICNTQFAKVLKNIGDEMKA